MDTPDTSALLVTGASGLVGTALARRRTLTPLPRRDPGGGAPWWEPVQDGVVHDRGQRFRAVVHLAGAGVADKRWTPEWKAAIRDSRVYGSRTLVRWMADLPEAERPEVLVAASAIGFYGDRGDEVLTEDAAPGTGFLPETCVEWEEEVRQAEALGVRTVRVRIGIVLSTEGGALERMLLPFKLGTGGPMGSGKQWFPWIHLDDLVSIIERAIDDPSMSGVYNAAAPGVVRQGDFARALGKALHRPAFLPTPVVALKAAMGSQMVEEALLASARVEPERLGAAGFSFAFPELGPALEDLVG